MSTTTAFVEAASEDPYVRELHRRAVRLLNDPSLDRQQREFHVRRLQSILLEHQAKQAAKAARLAEKKAGREQVSRGNGAQRLADQRQVVARRREYGQGRQEVSEPMTEAQIPAVAVANDKHPTRRVRPVLTLKKA